MSAPLQLLSASLPASAPLWDFKDIVDVSNQMTAEDTEQEAAADDLTAAQLVHTEITLLRRLSET